MVNGRLVFVPFDADALRASGFDALLGELAISGAAKDSALAVSERVQLELCRHTAHPRAADLAVGVLLDMAHQSLHLSRPDEALLLTLRFGLCRCSPRRLAPWAATMRAPGRLTSPAWRAPMPEQVISILP
jgi:hypothetical protein